MDSNQCQDHTSIDGTDGSGVQPVDQAGTRYGHLTCHQSEGF